MKIVDRSKVELEKIAAFVQALAAVEVQCGKMNDALVLLKVPSFTLKEEGVASLEGKFRVLKENFSLAKRDGRRALVTLNNALVKVRE